VASCYFHPERPGVGVCVRCRVVICGACCTRLDGVNHCHACLKALSRRADEPRAGTDLWPVLAGLVLTAGSLALFGLFWFLQGRFAS
jgi:hypothetical protein